MRRITLVPFVVFLVAQVSIVAAQLDLASDEDVDRLNKALATILPQNLLRSYGNVKFEDSIRADATKCSEQVGLLMDSVTNGTEWALKMLDASSKIPSGMMMGNRIDMGMYDECIAIRAKNEDGDEIRGRHCMYSAVATMGTFKLTEVLSVCLPAVCEPDEIVTILNNLIDMIKLMSGMDFPVTVAGASCTPIETPAWTAGGIATLVGFSLLLLFLAVSTICDALMRSFKGIFSPNSRLAEIAQFSIYSSALRILSTKTTPQTLPAFQGLRFFSMCWVILGHEYVMTLAAPTINPAAALEWVRSWDSLYIMIAPFSVDTFFAISGFLISYLFLKEMSTGRRFNIFAYYIHRYLRLTPAFAAMILLTIFILPRMGSGAVWNKVMPSMAEKCRSNWWPMLLYVHNYVNKKDIICLAHTWYLAVEMQFFLVSPFILYPLAKKPKIGLVVLGACFIAAVVTPAKIAYDNKYSNAIFLGNEVTDTFSNFYMETHIRAGAWIVGIFFGYLTFTLKGSTQRAIKWIGWLGAIAAFSFCIFSYRVFQNEDYEYNATWETFYIVVARPLWSFGVSWVIYASIRGFGGPVKTILSFSFFHPFSRISYCTYLVHFLVQMMKIGSSRVPRYFSDFSVFNLFLSDFVLSVIFGFICSLLFESPILTLEKIITNRNKRKPAQSNGEFQVEKVESGAHSSATPR